MYFSKSYIPTLKEAPGDAEIISHKLLIRAGMIRKLTSGIYTWLPLGLRSLNKAASIVRKAMDKTGAQEILMPSVQPADLWIESGRWKKYGKELLRFQDRHNRDYCLGPTHEEVMTDLIRGEVRSYRQLPMNLYQIQTKFRDEIRPRFGLIRCREFIMKDAYSFDRDDAGADIAYKKMYDAYVSVFTTMGLNFRPVQADSGSIGGSFSHEFMVLADTGEDTIVFCTACAFASNSERAPINAPIVKAKAPCPAIEPIDTPNTHTIDELCALLSCKPEQTLKTLLYSVDDKAVAVLLRGDRTLNEIKLKNLFDATEVLLATPEQVVEWTGAPVGYAGPIGLRNCEIIADHELLQGNAWIAGANADNAHIKNLDLARDVPALRSADLRSIEVTDMCPSCGACIEMAKGIEVGHVFKLGTKYSESMNATFLDETGVEQTIIMGSYGIGVSRVIAACVEQSNDEHGIVFPPPLAPYDIVLMNLDPKNPEVTAKAEEFYESLQARGFDVLFDDREERPGIKFKDADLLGIPMQIIVGGKGLAKGIVETKNRKTGEKSELVLDDTLWQSFETWHQTVLASWGLQG